MLLSYLGCVTTTLLNTSALLHSAEDTKDHSSALSRVKRLMNCCDQVLLASFYKTEQAILSSKNTEKTATITMHSMHDSMSS